MLKSDRTGSRVTAMAGLAPGALLVALAGATLAQPAPGPVPKGNHYQCYPAKQREAFKSRTVGLTDQFGARKVTITGVSRLCNPVEKKAAEGSGPILDKTLHLVCYAYKAEQTSRAVVVRNQFGVTTLDVAAPGELCLPSSKVILK